MHTASFAFRDYYRELAAFEVDLFGLSTQTSDYQRDVAERLHLQFEILSDTALAFASALKLPTFEAGGMRLIKRLTLIIREGRIEKPCLSRLSLKRKRRASHRLASAAPGLAAASLRWIDGAVGDRLSQIGEAGKVLQQPG